MRNKLILFVGLIFAVYFPLKGLSAEKMVVDGVAALVNTNTVTIGEVMLLVQSVQKQILAKYSGAELRAQMQKAYTNALNSLIDQRLIMDLYNKQENKFPDSYLDQRVEEIMQDMFSGTRAEFIAALAKEKINYDDWRKQMKEHVVVSIMRRMNVDQNLILSAVAVRAMYDANIDRYKTPAEIKLRMIAISNDASGKKKAEEVGKKLLAGADFAETAKAVSEDSRAAEGGDRGWIQAESLRPELAKRAAAMKKGETSDVIEVNDQLYILKVEDSKDAAVMQFADVSSQLERELRKGEAEKMYAAWMARLRKNAYVKVFDVDLF